MKQLIKNAQQMTAEDQYVSGMEGETPSKLPTWMQTTKNFFWIVGMEINALRCKITGKHNIEAEDCGDAENGPIHEWHCTRCCVGGREFGM